VTIAAANGTGQELWQSVCTTPTPLLPLPMVNIVSGGAHAAGAIDIQDILVIPTGARTFREAIEWADRVRRAAAVLIRGFGANPALVADEGGLAAAFSSNEAAIRTVTDAIHHAGLEPGTDMCVALDLAANQFFDGQHYHLRDHADPLSGPELIDTVTTWCRRYPIISIEDPLSEDSWEHWRYATQHLGNAYQLVGDDLLASNSSRVAMAINSQIGNAVLVKPNQAGSVTRAHTVVEQAHRAQYATILSARSGDTEDSWLADLAVGWRTGQIKVGSTHRSERTAKWNRLLEIESRQGGSAEYAGVDRPWQQERAPAQQRTLPSGLAGD
jgi:enolase